jgi:hypothetical protein
VGEGVVEVEVEVEVMDVDAVEAREGGMVMVGSPTVAMHQLVKNVVQVTVKAKMKTQL